MTYLDALPVARSSHWIARHVELGDQSCDQCGSFGEFLNFRLAGKYMRLVLVHQHFEVLNVLFLGLIKVI